MTHYLLTVEVRDVHGESYWSQKTATYRTPLTPAGTERLTRALMRRYPGATSIEISVLAPEAHATWKGFHNRHED